MMITLKQQMMKTGTRYALAGVILLCYTLLSSCSEGSVFAPDNGVYVGEPPQLYGARWVAQSLVYQGKDYSALGEGKQYTIDFMPASTYLGTNTTTEGSASGIADCNSFSASFSVNNQTQSLRLLNYNPTSNVCGSFATAFTQAIPQSIAYSFPRKDILRVDLLSTGYITFRRVLNPDAITPSPVNPVNFRTYNFPKSDTFNIRTITISGDTLRIDVHYRGCSPHTFSLAMDNTFSDADNTIPTYIEHNANGDTCTTERTESLFFSLAALRSEYARVSGRERGELKLLFSAGLENIRVIWSL